MNKKQIILTTLIVVASLLFNLALFQMGYHGDIYWQQGWGDKALVDGVSSLYLQGITDYPPLYLYILKFNSWLNYKLTGVIEPHKLTVDIEPLKPTYLSISKTIPTICNILMGLIIFFHLKKSSYQRALAGMILYLFNLAVIYNTAYWGQVDSANTLLMLLSIVFLIQKNYTSSTVLLLLAVLMKIQSIVLVPVIVAVVLARCDLKRIIKIILVNLFVAVLVLLPFIQNGSFWVMVGRCLRSVGWFPHVTVNAYNTWFLVSPVSPKWMDVLRDSTTIFGVTLRGIGFIFLGIYAMIVFYQLFKDNSEKNITLSAASMAFAFFMLPTEIHERYLSPFFALFMLAALDNRRYLSLYIILSITFLLNMMMVFPFENSNHLVYYNIQRSLSKLIKTFSFTNVAIVIAVVNTGCFLYLSKIGIFKGLHSNLKKDFSKTVRVI